MKGFSLNSEHMLEILSNDLKLLVISDNYDGNNSLINAIKLFFPNKENVDYVNIDSFHFEKNKFDLIICDIQKNKSVIIDTIKNISKLDNKQDVLIVTDKNDVDLIVSLLTLGISQIITLPLNNEEFSYRIKKSCETSFYKKYYELNKIENNSVNVEELLQKKLVNSTQFEEYLKQNDITKQKFEMLTQNLLDLNYKFNKCIEKIYINGFNQSLLDNMTDILNQIVLEFEKVTTLKKLSNVISELVRFLSNIRIKYLSLTQMDKLRIIEFIYDDISRYINTVFVFRDTVDIHYLEDSLSTSIMQLKQRMYNTELNEVELEIF